MKKIFLKNCTIKLLIIPWNLVENRAVKRLISEGMHLLSTNVGSEEAMSSLRVPLSVGPRRLDELRFQFIYSSLTCPSHCTPGSSVQHM